MVDPSSGIPAGGISFSRAFERVFDAVRPDAAELRASIECALEVLPEHEEIWAKWDAARWDVDRLFRDELAFDLSPNALIAYQRHAGGDEQVDPRYWQVPAMQQGEADESPPIFFWQPEFDAWLVRFTDPKSAGNTPRKREVGKRPRVKRYLAERFPQGVPDPAHCPREALRADLLLWDKTLDPLDAGTLKTAIDEYNAEVASDPK
jgi:hypothetical protein